MTEYSYIHEVNKGLLLFPLQLLTSLRSTTGCTMGGSTAFSMGLPAISAMAWKRYVLLINSELTAMVNVRCGSDHKDCCPFFFSK